MLHEHWLISTCSCCYIHKQVIFVYFTTEALSPCIPLLWKYLSRTLILRESLYALVILCNRPVALQLSLNKAQPLNLVTSLLHQYKKFPVSWVSFIDFLAFTLSLACCINIMNFWEIWEKNFSWFTLYHEWRTPRILRIYKSCDDADAWYCNLLIVYMTSQKLYLIF